MKYLKTFKESEIYNGTHQHYNTLRPVNRQVLPEKVEYSYKCNDCHSEFVTYEIQDYCSVCGYENIESITRCVRDF